MSQLLKWSNLRNNKIYLALCPTTKFIESYFQMVEAMSERNKLDTRRYRRRKEESHTRHITNIPVTGVWNSDSVSEIHGGRCAFDHVRGRRRTEGRRGTVKRERERERERGRTRTLVIWRTSKRGKVVPVERGISRSQQVIRWDLVAQIPAPQCQKIAVWDSARPVTTCHRNDYRAPTLQCVQRRCISAVPAARMDICWVILVTSIPPHWRHLHASSACYCFAVALFLLWLFV